MVTYHLLGLVSTLPHIIQSTCPFSHTWAIILKVPIKPPAPSPHGGQPHIGRTKQETRTTRSFFYTTTFNAHTRFNRFSPTFLLFTPQAAHSVKQTLRTIHYHQTRRLTITKRQKRTLFASHCQQQTTSQKWFLYLSASSSATPDTTQNGGIASFIQNTYPRPAQQKYSLLPQYNPEADATSKRRS